MGDNASNSPDEQALSPEAEVEPDPEPDPDPDAVGGWAKFFVVLEAAFMCTETISNWERVAVWSTAAQASGDSTLAYYAIAGSIVICIPYLLNTIVAIKNRNVLYFFLSLFRLHGIADLWNASKEYLESYERRRNVYGTQLVEQLSMAVLQTSFMFSATTRLLGPVSAIEKIPSDQINGGWPTLIQDVVFGGYILTSFMSTHFPTLNVKWTYYYLAGALSTLSFIASIYHRILSMQMLIFASYWSSDSAWISVVVLWIIFLIALFIIPLFLNINLSHYTEDDLKESPPDRHFLMTAMLWVYRVIVFIIVGFFSIYIVNFKTYEVVFYPPEFKPREDGHEVDLEGMKCACISVRFWGLIEIVLRFVFTYVVCFCWLYVWIPSIPPADAAQVYLKATISWAQSGLVAGAIDLFGVLFATIMYSENISCCLNDEEAVNDSGDEENKQFSVNLSESDVQSDHVPARDGREF